jgi:hypothetical protein
LSSNICGLTIFTEAVVKGQVDFQISDFSMDVSFFGAKLAQGINLELARFEKTVDFSGVEFHKPLNLDQAEFKVPPLLSGAVFHYETGDSAWDKFWGKAKEPDSYLRYLRLKKIAADAQDHEKELQFFVMETQAKRFHHYSFAEILHFPTLVLHILYELSSNFGLSMARPILWLVFTFVVSSCSFAIIADSPYQNQIQIWDRHILALSFSNISPISGLGNDMRVHSIKYMCNVKDINDCRNIDAYYQISSAEGFISLILLFLLGLGIRNRFRIK